ncbi:hypothetical protein Tco_0163445 [Tanacetum coccineum]
MLGRMQEIRLGTMQGRLQGIRTGIMQCSMQGIKLARMQFRIQVLRMLEIRMGLLLFQELLIRMNGNENVVAARAKGNEFDLMVAAAENEEIEEVNANCILMANLQQSSTSGTHADKAPVYD